MSSMTIRRWHSYIGLFIAPSVIFFALTGALQIYSLHESHGTYQPPAIVEKLSSVHKDQAFTLGHHHEPQRPDAAANNPNIGPTTTTTTTTTTTPPTAATDDDDEPALSTLVVKGFFLLTALGLSFSTAFGLWMGLTQTRQRRLAWALVISGALIPVVLLLL